MHSKLNDFSLPTLTFLIAALCGCSSGTTSTETIGSAAGSGDFLIKDAPIQSLVSFEAQVNEIRLESGSESVTDNLLSTPITVEFLGLQDKLGWLASVATLPVGTFTAIRLVMQPGAYVARLQDGNLVAISSDSDTLTVEFPSPVIVDGSGYNRFEIDLDLSQSLTGTILFPPLDFAPTGTVVSSADETEVTIDEIEGVVESINPQAGNFTFNAFADKDKTVALGKVTVVLKDSTVMSQINGNPFLSGNSMLGSMTVGFTTVEVSGSLGANQVLMANKVSIEDNDGGLGSAGTVKIEGLVSAIVPGTSFDLTIREIEKAAAIADPILSDLGDPGTITVSFDVNTDFTKGDFSASDEFALAVGQEVKVKFVSFTSSPFPAETVEVKDVFPEFDASILSLGGLPTNLIITLGEMESPVLDGLVASSQTPIDVNLANSTITLDTIGKPTIPTTLLWPNLGLEVKGTLGGTPTEPTLEATILEVQAGKIKYSVVNAINPFSSTLTLFQPVVDGDFGNGIGGDIEEFFDREGPEGMDVIVDPSCVINEGELDFSGLFALYADLDLNAFALSVKVRGLATGGDNEVRAFEIETEILEIP